MIKKKINNAVTMSNKKKEEAIEHKTKKGGSSKAITGNKSSKSGSNKNSSNPTKFGSSFKKNTTSKQEVNSKTTINNTNVKIKTAASITEWFFLCKQEITAKDIAEYLKPLNLGEVDLWEELNVLALEVGEKNSIDFEGLAGGFKEEEDIEFMKQQGFLTVFAVTTSEDNISIREVFDGILNQFPGAFCADTENFMPRIKSYE